MSADQETLEPSANPSLYGQDEALAQFDAALRHGRLHHSWIISGPRGIGKATFAYALARRLLSGAEDFHLATDHPVFRRIAASSHTDLLAISPPVDEKKGEGVISVEHVRAVSEFMSLTPAEGKWRIAIIDSADDMNTNAANAILKTLEEPPASAMLFLISHNPGKLLPTIRSRCRTIRLKPLDHAAFEKVMALFDIPQPYWAALGELSGNAPGFAQRLYAQNALEWYSKLLDCLKNRDGRACLAFAESASGAAAALVSELFLTFLNRMVTSGAGQLTTQEIVAGEGEVMQKLLRHMPVSDWAAWWMEASSRLNEAARLHYDMKITFLLLLQAAQAGTKLTRHTA